MQGFNKAAKNRVSKVDYVWIRANGVPDGPKGSGRALARHALHVDDQSYLFTGGYVPWWNEYPGMHIPAPLEIGSACRNGYEGSLKGDSDAYENELEFK